MLQRALGCAAALIIGAGTASAGSSIIVQSTTSTQNSGLYNYLLPRFKEKTGIDVHVVAVGTGQAIRNARNCDGDVLLVHAKAAEEKFVREGYGVKRLDLMYNDFVIVGPPSDPAGVAQAKNAAQALRKIAKAKAIFVSRGDNSGTHKKELQLWKAAAIDPSAASGTWYRETGSGMGATLNAAVGMGGYVMSDRATWISFRNKGDYKVLLQGDRALFNQYGVILVNPQKCPAVKRAEGQKFIDWLTGPEGQRAIGSYKLGGKQLFFPNAGKGQS
ncbi:MAG: sulfate transporter [Alphaproteobacteria bacterium]|nr:MAG: sulfate transporter [Alphaproteobacteria bacterium]